jgi:hypothetical protein
MAFRSKNEVQLEAARAALVDSDRKVIDIGGRRSAALLASDDNAQVLAFDWDLAELERLRKIQRDRIVLLEREVEREQAERRAKISAKHIATIEAELDKFNEFATALQKHITAAAETYRALMEHGLKVATIQAWPGGVQEACAFIPGEVLRLTRYEIARVGAGKIMHAGAVRRPDFPGAMVPSLDLQHQREKIPPIVDAYAERVAYAKKILHGGLPAAENLEKAS